MRPLDVFKLAQKISLIIVFFVTYSFNTYCQVGINTDGSQPDASSMLDVKSTDKGLLVPRLSSAQREIINAPAIGLLVFDTTTESFWFNETDGWIELRSGTITKIADNDDDTSIDVEQTEDIDEIKFSINGSERGTIKNNNHNITQYAFDSGGSNTLIGLNAGNKTNNNGAQNTFIRNAAGQENTTGSRNIFIGRNAGKFINNGADNVLIGNQAGEDDGGVFDGVGNLYLGTKSGRTNGSGLFNVFLGYGAGENSFGSRNVLIGYNSGSNIIANDRLYIDNTPTNNPLIFGRFDTNLLRINGTLNINSTYSFPTVDGSANQVLLTNGSGQLSWQDQLGINNQTIDTLNLHGTVLEISLENDGEGLQTIDLSPIDTDTDDQTIDSLTLNGTILEISLEDDNEAKQTVDLSSLDTDTNTDEQVIDTLNLNGSILGISLEGDNENMQTIDLSSIDTDTDTDDQTIDHLSLNGSILEMSLENDGQNIQTVNLSSIDTDTDDQTIDVLNLNGTTLQLSIENDGQSTQTVDLSSIDTDTDEQSIDVLSLNGSVLQISLEGDNEPAKSLNLNSMLPVGSIVMWPTQTIPNNWLVCNGDTIPPQYTTLITTLGDNIILPDMRGRIPLGAGLGTASDATNHGLGQVAGTETHTLTVQQIPAHSHQIVYRQGEENGGGNNYSDLSGSGTTDSTSNTGGGMPHNNMPPYRSINFIIKAK